MTEEKPSVRFTRRALEDLGIDVPPLAQPLNEIDHPLVDKAQHHLEATEPTDSFPRIKHVDDQVLHKCKVPEYRGAVWVDPEDGQAWIVTAGIRQDDTPQRDFYDRLVAEGQRRRKEHNARHDPPLTTDTDTRNLLPTEWDQRRRVAERHIRKARQAATEIERVVPELARRAARSPGEEQVDTVAGTTVGVVIEPADDLDLAYVGIRITGPVPADVHAVILAEVPGTPRGAWMPEAQGMPHRHVHASEIVYSTVINMNAVLESERD